MCAGPERRACDLPSSSQAPAVVPEILPGAEEVDCIYPFGLPLRGSGLEFDAELHRGIVERSRPAGVRGHWPA